MQLPHERIHELAVHVAKARAQRALQLTLPSDVAYAIEGTELEVLPYAQRQAISAEVANLVRKGQATVVFPSEWAGKGEGQPIQVDERTTIDNPEGWEDSWDRERAADEQRALEDGAVAPDGAGNATDGAA